MCVTVPVGDQKQSVTSTVQSPLILEVTTSSSAPCFSELILVNGLDYISQRQSPSFVQIREVKKGEANTNKPVKCLQGPQTICVSYIDFYLSLVICLWLSSRPLFEELGHVSESTTFLLGLGLVSDKDNSGIHFKTTTSGKSMC